MNKIPYISEDQFETEVYESEILVIVDVTANWCGPCRFLAPTLEAVAKENQGRVKIVKLDADENSTTAVKFGIRSIPTLLFFVPNNREPADRTIGAIKQQEIQDKINELLTQ